MTMPITPLGDLTIPSAVPRAVGVIMIMRSTTSAADSDEEIYSSRDACMGFRSR